MAKTQAIRGRHGAKREDGRWEGRIVVGHKETVTPSSGISTQIPRKN